MRPQGCFFVLYSATAHATRTKQIVDSFIAELIGVLHTRDENVISCCIENRGTGWGVIAPEKKMRKRRDENE